MSVSDIRKKRKNGESLENEREYTGLDRIREKRKQGIELDKEALNPDFSRVSNSNSNLTVRKNNAQTPTTDITSRRNPNSNREVYQQAIELARANGRRTTSQTEANAGNDRTTALREPQGNSILPTYSGQNIAANGANVNTDFKTEAATKNGWKGLNGTPIAKQLKGNGVTEKESLAHAEDVMNKYSFSDKAMSILDEYVTKDDESKRAGLWRFESQGSYSGALMNLGNKFKEETGVSDDEFKRIFESYSRLKHAQERESQQQEYAEMSNGKRVAKSFVKAPKNVLGGYQSLIGSLQNPSDPELGRDYNSEFFRYSNENTDIRKAQNDAINQIEDPTVRTLAHFGYNAGVMGVESATAALTGEAGLGSFFAGGYSSGLKDAEDRGLSPEQSQAYALAVGSLEYFTERIPWEGLKNIWAGKAVSKDAVKGSIMPYIKALLKQSGSEAAEEVINGIGDTIADGLIAGDKSSLNIAIENYMQQDGLSEEEATRKAIWDVVKDTADAAVTAAISAGVSAGPALTNQAYTVTKAGRNIADYENKTGNLTRNVENENYIPETRENYVADEDYRQAQETRQAILAASEKAAKGERISGREARALAESYSQTADNLRTAQKVEGAKLIEGARAKAEEKAIEQIKEASTPAEVETIKEENINSEAVQAAVAEKKAEMIKAGKATEAEFTEAITPTKAAAMAESGETIEQEVLEQLPEKVQQAYETGKATQANKLTSDVSKMDISTIEYANSEGKKIHADIKSVSENQSGEIVFNLSNGETVKAAEVDYTPNGRQLYNSPNGINSLDNPTLIQLAIDIERNSKHGVAVGNVTLALKDMYTMGAAGLDFDQAIKSRDFDLKTLGKDNLRAAYEEGKKNSTATSRATYAKKGSGLIKESSAENEQAYKNQFVKRIERNGKTVYEADESVRAEYENQLPESSKDFLELFSKKIGVDIAFFSENSNDRGFYEPKDGTIYLNLYHSHNMFNVALHEGIGEFMAASNEKAYNAIVDSVLNAYAANNSTKLAKDIRAYQAAYKGDTYGGTYRGAAQELFNDALSSMFSSEENMQKMFNWMAANEGEKQTEKVRKTLVDYLKSVKDTIHDVLTKGVASTVEERKLKLSEKEASTYVDQILKAMDQAIANRDAGAVQQGEIAPRNSLDLKEVLPTAKERNEYYRWLSDVKQKLNKSIPKSGREEYIFQIGNKLVFNMGKEPNITQFVDIIGQSKDNTIANIIQRRVIIDDWTANKRRFASMGRYWCTFAEISCGEEINIIRYYERNSIANKRQGLGSQNVLFQQVTADTDISNIRARNNREIERTSAQYESLKQKLAESDEETVRHSFAGINAATADKEQLKRAQELHKKGMGDIAILGSTGWFLGMDNQWKFEIPDNDLEIFKEGNRAYVQNNPDFKRYLELENKILFTDSDYTAEEYDELLRLDKIVSADEYYKTKQYGKLSDYIQHDELFRAYPWLENVDVLFVPLDDNTKGQAMSDYLTIALNEKFQTDVGWNKDALKSTLLHEIQHLIQNNENFARGSNPAWWADIKEERIEADKKTIAAAEEYLEKYVKKAEAAGEPTSTGDFVKRSIDRVTNPDDSYNMDDHWAAVAEWKADSSIYHYEHMISKLERHIDRMLSESDIELYYNTAGEIEARDTANRANMTKEQRLENFPVQNARDVVYPTGSVSSRRYSIKVDTQGRSLSEAQQKYFKDSKVVDEEGHLRVVYHGTQEEFYTFNPVEKGGKNGRAEGYGIYFADNKEITEHYGDRQLEGYLNMTKPAYSYKKTIKPAELAKLIEATCKAEAKMLMEDGGYDNINDAIKDTWVSNVVDTYSMSMKQAYLEAAATEINLSSNDMDIIIGVMNDTGVHNYEEAYEFYKILKDTLGFDGYITVWEGTQGEINNIYVAFDSNQFKQIDNLNPTEDADIRKSIKVDNQGRELSKGQQEYFKNSKVVDDNGDLMVLYHGSEQPGFTEFGNPKNWFTTNRNVAASYAASNNNIILDNVKSLDRLNELLSDTDYSVEQKNGKYVLYEQGFIDTREIDSFKSLEETINAANEALSEFDEGKIYEAYINLINPLEVDAQSNDFDNIEYSGNVYQTFELADYAKDNGYDGLIIRNVNDPGPYSEFAEEGTESDIVVAFNPNQIKSVDNDNPTESEDIRYSKAVNSDGNKLSVQQEEMFKNSKAVDKKGNLLVLYHGSQSEEKFNTFDMNVRGAVNGRAFGDGYYFTPYKDVAEFWGDNNLYSVYLNLEHPYYANKSSKVPKDVRELIVSRIEKSFAENGTKSFYSNKLLAMTDYLNEVHNAYDALEVLWNYGMINEIKSLGYDGVIFDDKDVPKYSVQYVAFNPEQIKETTNLNPTQEAKDIRYSISVGEDRVHTYKGIEIVQNPTNKEYQQMRADIIKERPWMDGPDTILLRHTYDEEGNEYYWDAYAGMHFEIEPIIASHWKTRVNQQWEWWKDDDKDFWANRSFANRARNSIKVYGEASPYADSLNETKVIQTMIGTMNNALSKADAFDISNDELIRIENYIANKYKTDLEPGEIAANISYAFAHMQQNKLDTDYENMMNYLLNIGDEIIKKSNMIDPASKELYDQARAAVSSKRFKLSDAERAEISNAFGGSWKAAFGAMQKAGIKLDNKNGTSIDTVFSEIREDILKAAGVDMSDADKPSQQILSIIDTITALEPTAYLWDGANEMDKALTVVSDIVDQYYSVATEQLEKNIAKGTKKGNEKIKKAIDNEKAKLRGQWAKYKDEKAEEFNSIVAEKNLIIQQQQNQIKQQQEQMKQWNAEAKEKDKAVVLDKKQMEATARLQAKQAVQNYKDREERAKQIENIKKTGIRLIKWLDNPTDNQHVPAFLQRPLAEFLSAIDFLPTNAKADSKSTLTWQQRMNDLREALVKIKDAESEGSNTAEAYFAQNIVAKELISMMDEFLGKEEWDEFTQSYIVTKRAAKKVSLLDAKELATLNKIMSALSVSINNMNKTLANNAFKHVSELAKASVKEVDALPAKKDMQKSLGKIFNFLNFDELEPITWFEGLGKGAKSVFQELRDGFDLKTRHVREADKYMDEAKKELGISDKELSTWKNQLHTFKLTEGTVMLNTTQIMSLYEILKRKQGRPHVAVGGIKAADFEYQDGKIKKKHHQPKAVHIRQTEAQAIIDTLTDEQKALADKMQQFMASDCAAWGNRVTEKMYGYKKYEEKDYFPLKTDAHSRATTASSDNNVSYYTIKNSSFTKPITPMANNAVVLDDIFDVFTDHVVSMADYDAYVMPIADAMRWFNYSERVINAIAPDELNEQGARIDYLGNMQESIDRVYGDAGLQYFRQFIKDINGDYAGRGGKSEILSSLMSMYKAQAVGANMRVVIQQPTAVVRAADQIEPKYLIRALASIPKAIEYAKKAQNNSEIAYWKAQGYYETYLGQSFKEIITGDTTLKDKFNDWSGFLAGQADDLSWGIMYKACEIKVAETQPELTGASFDKAVTKMFEGIVDHTQVVDTIFHKSQWMRSQELGHKVTSAFMAEPTKTYNMLYRAYRDAKLSGNKAFAMKRLRQVGLIFLFEQLLNAIITGGWDVLRDDEKENYISSFTKKFSENALDNLNPLNLLPIAKEITSAIQGYDATAYTTDAIYTAVDSFNVLLKIAQGKSTKTSYGNVYQIAKAASQLTGVPVANVMREFKTIYNLVNDFWGGKDLVNTQAQEKKITKKRETNRVSEVFDSNDLTAIKQEIQTAYNKGVESSKDGSESDGWSAARNMLKEQYQRLSAEHPEENVALKNRFKSLLKYTKKADGKGGYRTLTDKEVENYITNWSAAE